MNDQEKAHHRLLNAVITYIGADQNGSQQEIRDAVAELHASREESQKILYPPQVQVQPQGRKR
ncbi:MAG: hypothetical protein M0Z78_05830 [Betaproteobacteria bacterium]|nr:hypothetical protein [Betaproteobacteria bacterium]